MPRERVYSALVPFVDEDPARTVVDLSWSREAGHVQIATIAVDAATGDALNIVERFGSVSASSGDDESTKHECPVISGGLYMQLDRDGCNRLIRNLRRARDQAFGRDE